MSSVTGVHCQLEMFIYMYKKFRELTLGGVIIQLSLCVFIHLVLIVLFIFVVFVVFVLIILFIFLVLFLFFLVLLMPCMLIAVPGGILGQLQPACEKCLAQS